MVGVIVQLDGGHGRRCAKGDVVVARLARAQASRRVADDRINRGCHELPRAGPSAVVDAVARACRSHRRVGDLGGHALCLAGARVGKRLALSGSGLVHDHLQTAAQLHSHVVGLVVRLEAQFEASVLKTKQALSG